MPKLDDMLVATMPGLMHTTCRAQDIMERDVLLGVGEANLMQPLVQAVGGCAMGTEYPPHGTPFCAGVREAHLDAVRAQVLVAGEAPTAQCMLARRVCGRSRRRGVSRANENGADRGVCCHGLLTSKTEAQQLMHHSNVAAHASLGGCINVDAVLM